MEIRLSIQSKADGNLREIKRDIGEGLAVGRGAEEGILLDGPDLSREHLIISTDGKYIYVTDISNNGTWLNGTRLRRSLRTRVRTEDTIEVPGYVINIEPVAKPDETNDGAEVALVPSPPSAREPVPSSLPATRGFGGKRGWDWFECRRRRGNQGYFCSVIGFVRFRDRFDVDDISRHLDRVFGSNAGPERSSKSGAIQPRAVVTDVGNVDVLAIRRNY